MKLIARIAPALLAIALVGWLAPAVEAAPAAPVEGSYQYQAHQGRDTFRFSVEPNMNAKGKTIPGLRIAHITAYSKCSGGLIPTFYADTFGFKINKKGVVSINKTFKNKPISKDKITFKAKITIKGKKASGWYSINNGSQCKSDQKKTIKSFKYTKPSNG